MKLEIPVSVTISKIIINRKHGFYVKMHFALCVVREHIRLENTISAWRWFDRYAHAPYSLRWPLMMIVYVNAYLKNWLYVESALWENVLKDIFGSILLLLLWLLNFKANFAYVPFTAHVYQIICTIYNILLKALFSTYQIRHFYDICMINTNILIPNIEFKWLGPRLFVFLAWELFKSIKYLIIHQSQPAFMVLYMT